MSNSNIQALSDVSVVVPVIRIWSGQVTVRRDEDLSSASGLPPKTIVSDGGKRIVDPKALTTLETQRRCVNRDLANLGVKTPMGFLISPEREQEVHEEMARRKQLFEAARDQLVLSYDTLCAEWEAKNPEFVAFLRRNRPSAADVQSSCSFTYATYKVAPVDSTIGQQQFAEVAREATSSLVEDVASSAAVILKESFDGKERITQRTVAVVRELVRKLRGFSMFDPRISPTANALDVVLKTLPLTGNLEMHDMLVLRSMVVSMSDPKELLKIGINYEGALNDESAPEPTAQDASSPAAVTVDSKVSDPAAHIYI